MNKHVKRYTLYLFTRNSKGTKYNHKEILMLTSQIDKGHNKQHWETVTKLVHHPRKQSDKV